MIINITVDIDLDNVTDPANVTTRVGDALATALRTVEGVTSYRVTRVLPEDEPPPVTAKDPDLPTVTLEETP